MSDQTKSPELSRTDLKRKLRNGDMARVAAVANVGITTVWRWFNGESDNADIEPAVYAILEKNQSELNERLNSI